MVTAWICTPLSVLEIWNEKNSDYKIYSDSVINNLNFSDYGQMVYYNCVICLWFLECKIFLKFYFPACKCSWDRPIPG